MSRVRINLWCGAAMGLAGLAGAFAGLGMTAFWIAVLIGAPSSVFLERHYTARGRGSPKGAHAP